MGSKSTTDELEDLKEAALPRESIDDWVRRQTPVAQESKLSRELLLIIVFVQLGIFAYLLLGGAFGKLQDLVSRLAGA